MRVVYRIGLIVPAAALVLVPAASASHLAMPESALFDIGKIYVSLIGGPENNDGALVTVDANGKVTGTLARATVGKPLVDPTGIAVTGSTLSGRRWNAYPQLTT